MAAVKPNEFLRRRSRIYVQKPALQTLRHAIGAAATVAHAAGYLEKFAVLGTTTHAAIYLDSLHTRFEGCCDLRRDPCGFTLPGKRDLHSAKISGFF